jgi:hypothetical protein
MYFLSRTQVILAFGAVALAVYVLDLVRRRRLSEEYSLLWVVTTIGLAVLGFATPFLTWLTRLLGMMGESSTVFAFGLAVVLAMLLYQSVKLSHLGRQAEILAREVTLLRHDLERARAGTGDGA